MTEPVTLWDKGMFAMNHVAQAAAEYVGKHRGTFAGGSVHYNWGDNELTLYFSISGFREKLTHEKCNELRRYFIGYIAHGAHTRSHGDTADTMIHVAIGEWFSHDGFKRDGRDEKLEEKLARIIFVRVNLWTKKSRLMCRARITSPEAPSQPDFERAIN